MNDSREGFDQEQAVAESGSVEHPPGAAKRTAERPKNQPLQVIPASDIEPETVSWLWPDRIPEGKLTALCGDPGTGKSYLTLNLAARLSRGDPLPGEDTGRDVPETTLLLNDEDGAKDTIRPRLDDLGADLDRVQLLNPDSWPTLNDEEDRQRLKKTIIQADAGLVVIDPLASYCPGLEANSDEEVRSVLAPLSQIAEETGASIVFIRHLRKQEASHALHRLSGSVAYAAVSRTVLGVGEVMGQRAIAVVKNNLSEEPPILGYHITDAGIEWLGTLPVSQDDLFGSDNGGNGSELGRAKKFLICSLTSGPKPANRVKELARERGIAERTLTRARHELGVTQENGCVYPEDFGERHLWELPESHRGHSMAIPERDSSQNPHHAGTSSESANGGSPQSERSPVTTSDANSHADAGDLCEDPGDEGTSGDPSSQGSPPDQGPGAISPEGVDEE